MKLTIEQVRKALGDDWLPISIPYDSITDRLNALLTSPQPEAVQEWEDDGFAAWWNSKTRDLRTEAAAKDAWLAAKSHN